MNYAIIAATVGVILVPSAYLVLEERTATYKPTNPIAIIFFLGTLLVSGILFVTDWITTRYHMIVFDLKSGVNHQVNFMRKEVKMKRGGFRYSKHMISRHS